MEDLPKHPRHICRVCSPGQGTGVCDRHANQPQTQTSAPQLSTAQRRRNQAGQPRTGEGKYANKPESKWKRAMSSSGSKPVAPTSLKRVKTPARPMPARAPQKRKQRPLPSMASMMDRPLHHKVGYVVRRWFRRKKHHFKALFSLRG